MTVALNGETGASFALELTGRHTRRFVADGSGELNQGWALVHSDQLLTGSLNFGIRDSQGTVFTDVGVAESRLGSDFTLFADSLGSAYTGIAMANPHQDRSLEVVCTLSGTSGKFIAVDETRQVRQRERHKSGTEAEPADHDLFSAIGGIGIHLVTPVITVLPPNASLNFLGLKLEMKGVTTHGQEWKARGESSEPEGDFNFEILEWLPAGEEKLSTFLGKRSREDYGEGSPNNFGVSRTTERICDAAQRKP